MVVLFGLRRMTDLYTMYASRKSNTLEKVARDNGV
jgi:hypothetical protein